jgi:prolyl-tRNA synthetase
MNAKFLDDDGKEKPFVMGCYGLGVSRLLAAVPEANHDNDGIIWPISIAPFEAVILLLNPDDEAQAQAAVRVYEELQDKGVDVLLDERDERSGVKFKDADLIGIPVQIVVGRLASEGKVEMRLRWEKEKHELALDDASSKIAATVVAEKRKLIDVADRS